MKPGREYEIFIYNKLKAFLPEFEVTFDDKILGKESGIKRQIDTSIKGNINGENLLILVQCKDYTNPADITKIGEFASVLKDVGATKGYLICAGGFANTIHEYAKKLGIELLSIEDVNSDKWKVKIEIPFVYIQHKTDYRIGFGIIPTPELAEKNKVPVVLHTSDLTTLSTDGGATTIQISDHVKKKIAAQSIKVAELEELNLYEPNLQLKILDVWVPVSELNIHFIHSTKHYLKYLPPDEYSQITDHLTKGVTPLELSIKNFSLHLDDSFTEIDQNKLPVFTRLNFQVEEIPTEFNIGELKISGFRRV